MKAFVTSILAAVTTAYRPSEANAFFSNYVNEMNGTCTDTRPPSSPDDSCE